MESVTLKCGHIPNQTHGFKEIDWNLVSTDFINNVLVRSKLWDNFREYSLKEEREREQTPALSRPSEKFEYFLDMNETSQH